MASSAFSSLRVMFVAWLVKKFKRKSPIHMTFWIMVMVFGGPILLVCALIYLPWWAILSSLVLLGIYSIVAFIHYKLNMVT